MTVDLTHGDLNTTILFDVSYDGGTYYWSFQTITANSHSYVAKINPDNFPAIEMSKGFMGSERIHFIEDITLEIPNKDGTNYDAADFIGRAWSIHLYADDGTEAAVQQTFKMRVKDAKTIYQKMRIVLEDVIVPILEENYPATENVKSVWQSTGDSELGYCIPIPFGTPYIPLPSVYITDQAFYVLGENTSTYTIDRVRSPEGFAQSVWLASSYDMNQYTKDTYKVFEAIIADADGDGTADAPGVFKPGDKRLPIRTKYSRADTVSTTCPDDIIADLIMDGTGITTVVTGYALSPELNGAFYAKQPRYKWLASILQQGHAAYEINSAGNRSVKSLVKASVATVTSAHVIDGKFSYSPVLDQEAFDGGHVRFYEDGEPQDIQFQYKIGLGGDASTNPTSDVINCSNIGDSQVAQKMGILWLDRTIDAKGNVTFSGRPDLLSARPEDTLTISGVKYDATVTYPVVVQKIIFNKNLTVEIKATHFGHDISDYADLSTILVTPADDDTEYVWTALVVGPDGTVDTGFIPNALITTLTIRDNGQIKTGTDPASDGGLIVDADHIVGYNSAGLKTLELVYDDTNEGDAYFGDYDNDNAGIKYDHSEATLNVRGAIVATSGTLGDLTVTGTLTVDTGGSIFAGTAGHDRIEITPDHIKGISDALGTTFELPTDGSAPTFASGTIKEVSFEMYTSGIIKTNADPSSNGGLYIDSDHLVGYNSTPTKLLELIYNGTDAGDAYFGDFDSGNHGVKYDHSEGKLQVKGILTVINDWIDKSANFNAAAFGEYRVDTTSNTVTMTLPADPAEGEWVRWADVATKFSTNKFIIARNGKKIMGIEENFECLNNNEDGGLEYTGTTYGWVLF